MYELLGQKNARVLKVDSRTNTGDYWLYSREKENLFRDVGCYVAHISFVDGYTN